MNLPLPALKRLPEWRAKYGPDLLFIPEFGVIMRPATRGEVIRYEMNAASDPVWAQVAFVRECLLYPETWDDWAQTLGLRQFLSVFAALWKASGFRNAESFQQDLAQMRLSCLERDHAIIRSICAAFHTITPDDLNGMPRAKILYLLAQAECLLGISYDGQPMADIHESLGIVAQGRSARGKKRTMSIDNDVTASHNFETGFAEVDKPIQYGPDGKRR